MPCDKISMQQRIYDLQTLKGYIHDGVAMRSFAFNKRETRSLGINEDSEVDMVQCQGVRVAQ
jgi:hypothetical protein